jgi:hypothetical protein
MKFVKIVIIPALLAILVYGSYIMLQRSNKTISPLPEDGIKVIQVTPDRK